jgi:5-methyltetrahydropteroyltriglutamate--homocysteine methyltransferase
MPDDKGLIPGVITHTTNLVEHSDLMAERIERYASIVGREHVLAGNDCGFAARAIRDYHIHSSIVWAKFEALAEDARIASQALAQLALSSGVLGDAGMPGQN